MHTEQVHSVHLVDNIVPIHMAPCRGTRVHRFDLPKTVRSFVQTWNLMWDDVGKGHHSGGSG